MSITTITSADFSNYTILLQEIFNSPRTYVDYSDINTNSYKNVEYAGQGMVCHSNDDINYWSKVFSSSDSKLEIRFCEKNNINKVIKTINS
jgi:hypothetical protein